ncbi:hypothetical protein [Flavobacterium sp. TBRC 19031]|uniref:hypothetical protein n=1 Tax=Flavobacterium mekongense TaxID=3379707 RepID=UPI00399BAC73
MEPSLISKEQAQKKLAIIWLIAVLVNTLLFVCVCWNRSNDENSFSELTQWLFNYLSPGMTLIIGAVVYVANQSNIGAAPKMINKTFYSITLWFTIIFLVAVAVPSLLITLLMSDDESTINYYKRFNILLSFLHTSMLLLLGIFFTKENRN